MRHILQIVVCAVFIVFFSSLLAQKTFAAGEFEREVNVQYQTTADGKTEVTHEITLINKTSNYYADKYEIKLGSTKVSDVRAYDNVGTLETDAKFENNITAITISLGQRVIGLGKSYSWTLTYTSDEIAIKSGQIWEISIPKLAKSDDIKSYEAKVITPVTFGESAFADPEPVAKEEQGLNQVFTFTKDQLFESGISMSFGSKQVFEFTLDYYLENNFLTARNGEITLPPDNNYQKVVINSIDPPPLNVIVDEDNNYIAQYRLFPKQSININVKGFVEVFHKPFRNISRPLTEEQKELYLQPQKYWELDSSQIKNKASELETAEEIYDFVVDYLSYSDQRLNSENIERMGALAALNAPDEAVCMEFTDLFISLARSAGIPAVEVVGFAYTQNSRLRPLSLASQGDLLHAWPAYWSDAKGWVHIDPTWGSTSGGLDYFDKMDFNHITLAHRGLSSTRPFPAGAYKKAQDKQKKDVNIEFAANLPEITLTPKLTIESSDPIISGVSSNITVTIENAGSTSISPDSLYLKTGILEVISQNPVNLNVLPPFSTQEISFRTNSNSFITKVTDTLEVTFGDTQISRQVEIVPFYLLIFTRQFIVIFFSTVILIIGSVVIYKKMHFRKIPFTRH